MKCLTIALLMLLSATVPAIAENPLEFELPTTTQQAPEAETQSGKTFEDSRRLAAIEQRLAAIEATAIDADEARQIAEEVVDKRINELRLAISTPGGGQRVETVKFQTMGDVGTFDLRPGERLSSYTDAYGRTVQVNSPAASTNWATNDVRFAMAPQSTSMTRTVQVRPVRRGLFGRQRTVTQSYAPMATTASSCRMVSIGGRMVKVCN